MEYRLTIDGEAITRWERVSARDIGLWTRSIRATQNIAGSTKIDVESRKLGDRTLDLDGMKKADLRTIADDQGLDVAKNATRQELIDKIREA